MGVLLPVVAEESGSAKKNRQQRRISPARVAVGFQFDRSEPLPYKLRPSRDSHMANIRSAEKNIRKTAARTAANQTVKSRVRTLRKNVLAAIEKGDAAAATVSLNEFASAVDK